MKPIERMGVGERAAVQERRANGYTTNEPSHFPTTTHALRALLDRLLPGVPDHIDLAAFVDSHTGQPMGRGDRRPGVPAQAELFALGLAALDAVGFADQAAAEQRALISRMREGQADEELGVPAQAFVDQLLDKALIGYLAHPDTWDRIGFGGPAYPEGYAWTGPDEAEARRRHAPGWDRL